MAAAVGDPGLGVRAIAGLGEVDSATPVWSMWDLSRIVKSSPALTAEFVKGTAGVVDFLERFGSRCMSEWDLGVLAWESDTGVPITAIDKMRAMPDSQSPTLRHATLAADR